MAMSSSGSTIVTGDYNYGSTGRVVVYGLQNDIWNQIGGDIVGEVIPTPPSADTPSTGHFGWDVSLSSTDNYKRVAVGTYIEPSDYRNGYAQVYEYDSSQNSWQQLGTDINPDASEDVGSFGRHVSLSSDGTHVAVSDTNTNNNYYTYVYKYENEQWIKKGSRIDGGVGLSVDLNSDGSRVMIMQGVQVDIYEWDSSSSVWNRLGHTIQLGSGEILYDTHSMNSDGTRIAMSVHASTNFPNIDSIITKIYEYNVNSQTWVQLGNNIEKDATEFLSLSLNPNGDQIAISDAFHNSNTGVVEVWEYNSVDASWIQKGQSIDGEMNDDRFGFTISLGSSSLASGSCPADESYDQYVYVYEFTEVQ